MASHWPPKSDKSRARVALDREGDSGNSSSFAVGLESREAARAPGRYCRRRHCFRDGRQARRGTRGRRASTAPRPAEQAPGRPSSTGTGRIIGRASGAPGASTASTNITASIVTPDGSGPTRGSHLRVGGCTCRGSRPEPYARSAASIGASTGSASTSSAAPESDADPSTPASARAEFSMRCPTISTAAPGLAGRCSGTCGRATAGGS